MGCLANSPHSAHQISQVFTARSKGLHRPRSLTLGAPGEAEPHRGAIRQRPCNPASLNLIARSRYDREYSSNTFSSTQRSAAPPRKLVTPGNRRQRGLEFGRFRVLLRRRQLLADGVAVELGGRALDVLLVLLEADGALVTKEELLSRVWPGVVVSEENLKSQVHALRKALGADRDPILTEFGRGYRFTGVLRMNIVLEPCWPMRPKRQSDRIFFLQSCRHSPQCSVNSISRTDR
jgi:DNA-binding winged helix-turn-helix (wHTH) protein